MATCLRVRDSRQLRIDLYVAVHSGEEVWEHSANDEVLARFSELDSLDAVLEHWRARSLQRALKRRKHARIDAPENAVGRVVDQRWARLHRGRYGIAQVDITGSRAIAVDDDLVEPG